MRTELKRLCLRGHAFFIIENPMTSVMGHHKTMRRLKMISQPWKHIVTWLGAFGADCPKPINLWSNAPYLNQLCSAQLKDMPGLCSHMCRSDEAFSARLCMVSPNPKTACEALSTCRPGIGNAHGARCGTQVTSMCGTSTSPGLSP